MCYKDECPANGNGHSYKLEVIPSEFVSGVEGGKPVEIMQCEYCGGQAPVEPPKYMFEGKPTHTGTWLELQANDKLRVYDISNHVAMLVEPDTGDYCYVYWDEAAQCSNPYPTFDEAAKACEAYIAHL